MAVPLALRLVKMHTNSLNYKKNICFRKENHQQSTTLSTFTFTIAFKSNINQFLTLKDI